MRIVHLAAEMAPVAKVGGLADVVLGLSRAQIAQGHEVVVLLPKYAHLDPLDHVMDVPVHLVDVPGHFLGPIYSGKNLIESYLRFCAAALQWIEEQPPFDLVHLHDWHAAGAALVLESPKVLTIHNYAYQGECAGRDLALLGLKRTGKINLLKEGMTHVDAVTTVSPTYAKELQASDPFLKKVRFEGILNGLDPEVWDPLTDPYLPKNPKKALREQLGLADEPRMLVAAITRLVPQKAPDLLEAALVKTLALGGQFVLLGSVPDPETQAHFTALQKRYRDDPHVFIDLEYNEPLAHLIYGGSDLLLVPSIFEPCGLTQLIAMRYGTIPLVRRTGGLADTVEEGVTGFTFGPPTKQALDEALERAARCFEKEPDKWENIRQEGIKRDFSWAKSAEAYAKLYRALVSEARQKSPAKHHAGSEGP